MSDEKLNVYNRSIENKDSKTDKNSIKKSAEDMAKKQRDIGVGEFFARNRHLLGFDNKRKALMTTVKEAVDNALDACEEARILPEIIVEIIDMGNERYRIIIEDNGPGIVKQQIPKIFAKLLYGSKFHKLSQSRGQQGIGISAAVMYGQLTTGRPAKVTSKTAPDKPAIYMELKLETKENKPEIIKEEIIEWTKDHGTRIEIDLEGTYIKGPQSVDIYLKQTAIVNPHATIIYTTPKAEQFIFARATEEMPKQTIEQKPHPYGVELGVLMDMLKITEHNSLQAFLTNEFSRVGNNTAKEICENARLLPKIKPKEMDVKEIEQLLEGIKKTKIAAPSADSISPIGAELLEFGLKKEIKAEFYCAITRTPEVYRGFPFIIECALAYGGEQEQSPTIMRFANRVPLLYQQGACGAFKAASTVNWRQYGLSQNEGSLPNAPITILVHISSVWVPYTSESKEALAHYPEIIKEIKLAIQELGRKLSTYVRKKKKIGEESKKRSYIEKYLPIVSDALISILKLPSSEKELINQKLGELLEQERGIIENIEDDNAEYDEEYANIGKGDEELSSEEKNEDEKKSKKTKKPKDEEEYLD